MFSEHASHLIAILSNDPCVRVYIYMRIHDLFRQI